MKKTTTSPPLRRRARRWRHRPHHALGASCSRASSVDNSRASTASPLCAAETAQVTLAEVPPPSFPSIPPTQAWATVDAAQPPCTPRSILHPVHVDTSRAALLSTLAELLAHSTSLCVAPRPLQLPRVHLRPVSSVHSGYRSCCAGHSPMRLQCAKKLKSIPER